MIIERKNLLLADDDLDDCLFFQEALEDLPLITTLKSVNNGVELMSLLSDHNTILPDALFLDLNMPRKSGFECLSEIRTIDRLKDLPVIIFSTSTDMKMVDTLFSVGANYYIQKPGEFSKLKKVIFDALNIISDGNAGKANREEFILHP